MYAVSGWCEGNNRIPEEPCDLQHGICCNAILRQYPDDALCIGLAPDDAKVLFQSWVAWIVAPGRDDQQVCIAYALDDGCGAYADLGVRDALAKVLAYTDSNAVACD